MDVMHKQGTDRGKVMLYALSTCVWCKRTKHLLDSLGVAYDYIYVDLLDDRDREIAKKEITKWNPRCSFPTLVLEDKACVIGFDEQKIKEALDHE